MLIQLVITSLGSTISRLLCRLDLVFYDYYRISMIAVDNPNIIKTLSNNQLFKIPWIHHYKKYDYVRQVFFLTYLLIYYYIYNYNF